MLTSEPALEVRPIQAARASVGEILCLLRTPPIIDSLANCAGPLAGAIQCLRNALGCPSGSAQPAELRSDVEALARDVGRLNALLGRAIGFHVEWARLLSREGEAYDRRGRAPENAPGPQVVCEG